MFYSHQQLNTAIAPTRHPPTTHTLVQIASTHCNYYTQGVQASARKSRVHVYVYKQYESGNEFVRDGRLKMRERTENAQSGGHSQLKKTETVSETE